MAAWMSAVQDVLTKQQSGESWTRSGSTPWLPSFEDLSLITETLFRSCGWKSNEGAAAPQLLAEGLKAIFDLSVGPLSFKPAYVRHRSGSSFVPDLPAGPVPGPSIEQNIFLDRDQELDDFATDVAYGTCARGVYMLSGVRGGGKSTALNRIEWFCNNWPDPPMRRRGKEICSRPVLVRFDLGSSFQGKPFLINLLAETCRATRLHAQQPPVSSYWSPNWAWHVIGRVGRWCETNLAWVLLLLTLSGFFSAISNLEAVGPIDEKTAAIARSVLGVTTGILMIGFSYRGARAWAENHRSRVRQGSPWSALAWPLALVALVWVLFHGSYDLYGDPRTWLPFIHSSHPRLYSSSDAARTAAAAIEVANSIPRQPSPTTLPSARRAKLNVRLAVRESAAYPSTTQPVSVDQAANLQDAIDTEGAQLWKGRYLDRARHVTDGLVIFCVWLALVSGVCIATLFLLPTWWWTYVYCSALSEALQAKKQEGEGSPEVPYFSQLTTVVRALLPRPVGVEEVRDLDTPFLQEQLKLLLSRCARTFDGLVVLIDDVDVLPSERFAELFQVLRPFSKVENVRCVVCTPMYFDRAYKSSRLSDLHSTVAETRVVGDRLLADAINALKTRGSIALPNGRFELEAGRSQPPTALLRQYLLRSVSSLLFARCRLRLGPDESDAIKPLVELMVGRWDFDPEDNDTASRLARVLSSSGASRREILRECELLLSNPLRKPFEDHRADADEQNEQELVALRAEYRRGEIILNADPSAHSNLSQERSQDAEADMVNG